MKRWILNILLLHIGLLTCNAEQVVVSNKLISMTFDMEKGELVSFRNNKVELLDIAKASGRLWVLHQADGQEPQQVLPLHVSVSKISERKVELQWNNSAGFQLKAVVEIDESKPLSYWSVWMNGLKGLALRDVQFPVIHGLKDMGEEELAVSSWLGNLIKNPRQGIDEAHPQRWYAFDSPGGLSMQMITLYGKSKNGVYFAAEDTMAYVKRFGLVMDKSTTDYSLTHFPSYDKDLDEYHPTYRAVVGCIEGDWLTAAELYRDWATKQKWCRESRFKNGETPDWVTKTGMWIWNRGRSENVLTEARDLKQRLKLPVNVFWHWWHGCSYDEGFPEYLPPREGRASFRKAVGEAKKDGVRCIVYMNSFQWGNSTESWEKENAQRYSAKNLDGKDYSHAFNIFTGRQLTPMCMGTDFWRQKYASLCDSVVNRYGVSGVYMDQACSNLKCYDASHGHTLGGGNYWVDGFSKLTHLIRQKIDKSSVRPSLGGEGSGEDWIPNLDLFLTLEASRERYMGVGNSETIPLYQAVYHDYAITYGSYSSLVYPPYDDLWPVQYRPANREKLLPEEFNMQYRMEQARSFVWGMQPTLANYHSFLNKDRKEEVAFLMRMAKVRYRALKYLLHGVYVRVPEMQIPEDEIAISKISIYAGRSGNTVTKENKRVPLLYAGGWKAADGNVAVALANISNREWPVDFEFESALYGLSDNCKVYLITESSRRLFQKSKSSRLSIHTKIAPRESYVLEFVSK